MKRNSMKPEGEAKVTERVSDDAEFDYILDSDDDMIQETGIRQITATGSPSITAATPAMLELAAAYPFYTVQRDGPNTFVPDTQMMFHVLSICDQLMVSTNHFTCRCPFWLPIVSQLYISVLWITHILRVQVSSCYGAHFRSLLDYLTAGLRLETCMIPGPLVPFFQATTAINGPYKWSGDIIPLLPYFNNIWNQNSQCVEETYGRHIPFPALLLDQLAMFSFSEVQSTYETFLWYENVFGITFKDLHRSYSLGPQTCGSLHVSQRQFGSAREFWAERLADFSRMNLTKGYPRLTNYHQFLGFETQYGTSEISWLLPVSLAMQKYCRYFSESTTLGSILPTGIGASAVYGTPVPNMQTSNWLYPKDANLFSFPSTMFEAPRAIPDELTVCFQHADYELEEQAEQFAIETRINIDWSTIKRKAGWLVDIDKGRLRSGNYWNAMIYRISSPTSLTSQLQHIIISKYHQRSCQDGD